MQDTVQEKLCLVVIYRSKDGELHSVACAGGTLLETQSIKRLKEELAQIGDTIVAEIVLSADEIELPFLRLTEGMWNLDSDVSFGEFIARQVLEGYQRGLVDKP